MKIDNIDISNAKPLGSLTESCGAVAVECSAVGGILKAVTQSSQGLRAEHLALLDTVAELEQDQTKVSQASEEARLLSEQAIGKLSDGTEQIRKSLDQIVKLTELVERLGSHVTGFAAAMEQVRRSSLDINQIAETTNILALNATIEAMRAGEAGQTFGVVAADVKGLAADTKRATQEITATIDKLSSEADQVVERMEQGNQRNESTRKSVLQIEEAIGSVVSLVEDVDSQNDQIARSTATISSHVDDVHDVLHGFGEAAIENESKLEKASQRMIDLEVTASEMFDHLVKAGLSDVDSAMVATAKEIAAEFADVTKEALESGALSQSDLFDRDYKQIEGSNPARYRTGLTKWADANWRPMIDKSNARGRPIKMVCLSDSNGFMPTHCTERSATPTGDLVHDTLYCRNGRIILDPVNSKAKESNDDFTMAVYRQEGDGTNYYVVRNIYIPLVFDGKRWGDLELAYILDDAAWPKG